MGKGIPVPKLTEEHHADNSAGVATTCTALEADRDIAATCVDETLTQSSTETCHGVVVLVGDNLRIQCTG